MSIYKTDSFKGIEIGQQTDGASFVFHSQFTGSFFSLPSFIHFADPLLWVSKHHELEKVCQISSCLTNSTSVKASSICKVNYSIETIYFR